MSSVTSLLTIWLCEFEDVVIAVSLGGSGGGAISPFSLLGRFGETLGVVRE